MKHTTFKEDPSAYPNLVSLPRDRNVLDFVKQKLEQNSSPDRQEAISKIMEMYRTSAGFDPMALTRARFKKIKPAAFRKVLAEIDRDIEMIMTTDDYKALVQQGKLSGAGLLKSFVDISSRLREGKEVSTEETELLKKNLVAQEEYDLLVSFYKTVQPLYMNRYPELCGKTIEEYRQVHTMAQLSYEHVLAGYSTRKLTDDAENGKRVQAELFELYEHLSRLIMQYLSPAAKYQNLIRILSISLHMHSRRQHIEPYLEFAARHFHEITTLLPDESDTLARVVALYMQKEPFPVREKFLKRALALKQKYSLEKTLMLHIAMAELYLDTLHISKAEAQLDHCYRLTEDLVDKDKYLHHIAWNLFLVELSKIAATKNPASAIKAEALLDTVELTGRNRKDNAIRCLELRGMLMTAAENFSSARNIFNEASSYRETYPDAVFSIADKFFVRLLSSYADPVHLNSMIEDLELLREPVYSTLLVSVMKVLLQKRNKVEVGEFEE